MTKITDYLVGDHARLHALLGRAMAGPEVDVEAYRAFRGGLLRHIAIEEKLLLSAVRKLTGALSLDELHRIRVEHAALTSLLVPTPDHALLGEIGGLLAHHDAREEGTGGVYQRCEAALGAFSATLAERAHAFSAVPLMRHFDGAGTHRTAQAALQSAERLRPPRARTP